MSQTDKPIWLEGMFLRHEHFQQMDRYVEKRLKDCAQIISSFSFGFSRLVLDQQHLSLGRIAIADCAGLFPDRTFFDSATDCDVPPFFQVPDDFHNRIVYLAIPLRGADLLETNTTNRPSLARFTAKTERVRDNTSEDHEPVEIEVARLNLKILTENDDLSQFAVLPMARVMEKRSDGSLILDPRYIPTCLDVKVSPVLSGFMQELVGLLYNRGEDLAARVTRPGAGGSSAMLDFLLLQLINRYETFLKHLSRIERLHPELFFEELLKLYGELSTVTSSKKRLTVELEYDHENLAVSFAPIFEGVRQALSVVLEQTAIPMQLQMTKQGIRVALLKDKSLLDDATFVLAAKANVAVEQLRTRFPAQIKIGPVEKIRGLINIQLPGIPIEALPVAPEQIPYHSGFTYFRLDRDNQFWKYMNASTGFAFHISGEFPGLELEFWAIKG
jgi:type VI secretion system protein ImpJ